MSIDLYAESLKQLETLQPHERIIVLHPNCRFRHHLAHTLLGLPYTYPIALNQLEGLPQVDNIVQQVHIFTDNLISQGFSPSHYYIFLDDADLLPDDYLTDLLLSLLSALDTSTFRIVFNGRYAPHQVLYHPYLKNRIRLLPVNEPLLMLDYTQRQATPLTLEVIAFGQGRVFLNSRLIEWSGDVPRQLFFYFIDNKIVLSEDVFKIFWPDMEKTQATNVFHVTNGKIKKQLNGVRLTDYRGGYYHLSTQFQIYYDVTQFQNLFANLNTQQEQTRQRQLEQLLYLYQADFLFDIDNDWANQRRLELRAKYHIVCVSLADIYERQGAILKAIGMLLRVFKSNRLQEDIVSRLMQLYHRLDDYDKVKEIYALHADAVDSERGSGLSQHLKDLYQQIFE